MFTFLGISSAFLNPVFSEDPHPTTFPSISEFDFELSGKQAGFMNSLNWISRSKNKIAISASYLVTYGFQSSWIIILLISIVLEPRSYECFRLYLPSNATMSSASVCLDADFSWIQWAAKIYRILYEILTDHNNFLPVIECLLVIKVAAQKNFWSLNFNKATENGNSPWTVVSPLTMRPELNENFPQVCDTEKATWKIEKIKKCKNIILRSFC